MKLSSIEYVNKASELKSSEMAVRQHLNEINSQKKMVENSKWVQEDRLESLQAQLAELQSQDDDDNENLQAQIAAVQAQIAQTERTIEQYERQNYELESEIDSAEAELSRIEREEKDTLSDIEDSAYKTNANITLISTTPGDYGNVSSRMTGGFQQNLGQLSQAAQILGGNVRAGGGSGGGGGGKSSSAPLSTGASRNLYEEAANQRNSSGNSGNSGSHSNSHSSGNSSRSGNRSGAGGSSSPASGGVSDEPSTGGGFGKGKSKSSNNSVSGSGSNQNSGAGNKSQNHSSDEMGQGVAQRSNPQGSAENVSEAELAPGIFGRNKKTSGFGKKSSASQSTAPTKSEVEKVREFKEQFKVQVPPLASQTGTSGSSDPDSMKGPKQQAKPNSQDYDEARLAIFGLAKKNSAEFTHPSDSLHNENQILAGKSSNFYKHGNSLGLDYVAGLHRTLSKSSHINTVKLFEKYAEQIVFRDSNVNTVTAKPKFRIGDGIYFNAKEDSQGSPLHKPFQAGAHEMAHFIDYMLGNGSPISESYNDGALLKAINGDFMNLKGNMTNEELIKKLKVEIMSDGLLSVDILGVSDILESLTNIKCPLNKACGHGLKYWKNRTPCAEFFAEVIDSQVANERSYQMFKKYFPNAVDVVEEIIRKYGGGE